MINVGNYQRNANQKREYHHLTLLRLAITKKSTNAGEDVEKRESSYTVDGKVNQYNHDGEQCGDPPKT